MRLGIDAMGGDHAPQAIIEGVIQAKRELDVELLLYGRREAIEPHLQGEKVEIVHCEEVIEITEDPVAAIRKKLDSSLVRGCVDLKEKRIDGFMSAGSTGALLAGGLFKVGRMKGIERPALVITYPMGGGFGLIADAGANADCKPKHLLDFAVMSSYYARDVLGIKNPRVGLVNIGEEETKGNALTKEAYALLKASDLHFVGNIEGREIPSGGADVVICDGFTGNVILKVTEGLADTLMGGIKEIFMKNTLTKLGSLIYKSGLRDFKKKLDYTEYGGAPLMGVKGYLVKAHGSSNAKAIKNGILYMHKYVESGLNDSVMAYLEKEEK